MADILDKNHKERLRRVGPIEGTDGFYGSTDYEPYGKLSESEQKKLDRWWREDQRKNNPAGIYDLFEQPCPEGQHLVHTHKRNGVTVIAHCAKNSKRRRN